MIKNNYQFPFEKLEVWRQAIEFAESVYQITSTFPKYETFGISSQMQRAAVSVSSNIAEGSVRFSSKEQIRFYEMAFGSLMEVLNQVILVSKLGYISEKDYVNLRTSIENISRMLNALRKSKNNEQSE